MDNNIILVIALLCAYKNVVVARSAAMIFTNSMFHIFSFVVRDREREAAEPDEAKKAKQSGNELCAVCCMLV